ncbi:MAG: type I phosphomannose isomerase catalytic subunit [Deinococcota bacterium]
MKNDLYPLQLERILSPRLWGGSRLQTRLHVDYEPEDGGDPLGEVWQAYKESIVQNGHLAEQSLAQVAETYEGALLGERSVARYGKAVPLLAKFIGAEASLSIQVHPDDSYAKRVEAASGHLGKTEAWYILEAEPDAHVLWGFNETMTPEGVREAISEEKLEQFVNIVPVRPGDVIYNPAGTLHAIGAGIVLFEIQQSSDLTYRVYDYGRRDGQGNLRELHVDKALEVLDYSAGNRAKILPKQLDATTTELIRVEAFAMERWDVAGERHAQTSETSLEILTLLDGTLSLSCEAADAMTLGAGETVLLAANLGDYQLAGEASLLRCFLP